MDKIEQKVLEYEVTAVSRESVMNTSSEGADYEGRVAYREDERQPFTTLETDDDLRRHVTTRKPRNRHCVLSRCCCAWLVVFVIILLLLIGLLIFLILVKPCYNANVGFHWCNDNAIKPLASQVREESNQTAAFTVNIPLLATVSHMTNSTAAPNGSLVYVTEEPSHPWSNIRLPRSILPTSYAINLRIDLKQLTFKGSVEIDLVCQELTSHIVLHAHALNIDNTRVAISNMSGSGVSILAIKRVFPVVENQYYVIETFRVMRSGERYQLRFGDFRAPLRDDLHGLYYSAYVDEQNLTRYVDVF